VDGLCVRGLIVLFIDTHEQAPSGENMQIFKTAMKTKDGTITTHDYILANNIAAAMVSGQNTYQ